MMIGMDCVGNGCGGGKWKKWLNEKPQDLFVVKTLGGSSLKASSEGQGSEASLVSMGPSTGVTRPSE